MKNDTTLTVQERVTDLVSRMTLEEKVGLMSHPARGVPRLGIPAYNGGLFDDGDKPHCHAEEQSASLTYKPSG